MERNLSIDPNNDKLKTISQAYLKQTTTKSFSHTSCFSWCDLWNFKNVLRFFDIIVRNKVFLTLHFWLSFINAQKISCCCFSHGWIVTDFFSSSPIQILNRKKINTLNFIIRTLKYEIKFHIISYNFFALEWFETCIGDTSGF